MSGQLVADLTLYCTRTMAYALHKEKLILTDRWVGYPPKKKLNKNADTNSFHFPGHAEKSVDQTTHIRTCACDLTTNNMLGSSEPYTEPGLLAWPVRSLPVLQPELCDGQSELSCGSQASTPSPPSTACADSLCAKPSHGISDGLLPGVGGPDDESEQWLSSSVAHHKPLCDQQCSPQVMSAQCSAELTSSLVQGGSS